MVERDRERERQVQQLEEETPYNFCFAVLS